MRFAKLDASSYLTTYSDCGLQTDPPIGFHHFDKIFGDLAEIEWLKLPKKAITP